MKVMAVVAHPDDIELLCAGTLAKFKAKGHDIAMVYLCKGDKGHFEIPPSELVEIRRKEAENSAKILDAEVYVGFFSDLQLFVNRESVDVVIRIIRKVKPDLIITHSPEDYMMDHINASRIAVDASFIATLPNYETDQPAHTKICPIYFMDTLCGVNFQPTEYVDITDFMEIKEKMLLCHQSQYKWLKEHDNIDYVEFMKNLSAFRGAQCGVKYAEGFRPYLAWGRIKPYRLLP